MSATSTRPIRYRGVLIQFRLDRDGDNIFGHADLFADDAFKARLSLGSNRHRPKEVLDRLRCLAKSKVDAWAIAGARATTG
ncbi:MAG: hypothetical protein JSS14_14555 [Proteobacteria bacterium]|nr:hypothetical protein [Pseudomonadota bacterium]